ncbi:hypothetical protein C8T65DRAFT_662074 [Cerioporus squamosus]|nr:hypothetical protein C8T65DRAFT_662074 [Cerioporus squamosus]
MRRKGYEVWIALEGQALQEFQIRLENGGRKVACFIPSETGKCFSIHCSDLVQQSFFSMEVTLDGRFGGRTLCAPGSTSKRDGLRTSETMLRRYQFAEVLTTDADASLSDTTDLGTIEVALMRRYPGSRDIPFQAWSLPGVGTISERAKTMGVQQVTLGEEVTVDGPGVMQEALPLHPAEGCFVTFVFRYRPLAILQAQGIAPLQPRTESGEDSRRCVIVVDPAPSNQVVQSRLSVPAPDHGGPVSAPGIVSVPTQGSSLGSVSERGAGEGKRPAEASGDETDTEEQTVESLLRPTKRARLGETPTGRLIDCTVDGSDEESELDTLKAGVESLKAQLKRMEGQISSIEKTRRSSRSRWMQAGRGPASPRVKKEEWEPPTLDVKREMITEGVIDLTLAD